MPASVSPVRFFLLGLGLICHSCPIICIVYLLYEAYSAILVTLTLDAAGAYYLNTLD